MENKIGGGLLSHLIWVLDALAHLENSAA